MNKNIVFIKFKDYCFEATLIPTLIVLFLFPLLIYLGCWQIHRGNFKANIQKIFDQRSLSTPINVNLDKQIDSSKKFFPAIMRGHFDNQHSFLLENRIYLHRIGYEVLTPFILKGSHEVILVNRGWIPQNLNRKKLPDLGFFENELSIKGLIVFPNKSFSFKQNDVPAWPKRIQTTDPDFLKKNHFQPFMLIISTKQNYSFTPLWQPVSLQANRHYAYAFQWFCLSLTLLIAFFSPHIRRL